MKILNLKLFQTLNSDCGRHLILNLLILKGSIFCGLIRLFEEPTGLQSYKLNG